MCGMYGVRGGGGRGGEGRRGEGRGEEGRGDIKWSGEGREEKRGESGEGRGRRRGEKNEADSHFDKGNQCDCVGQ